MLKTFDIVERLIFFVVCAIMALQFVVVPKMRNPMYPLISGVAILVLMLVAILYRRKRLNL